MSDYTIPQAPEITDAGTNPPVLAESTGPTAGVEGAIENSPRFQEAARKAWRATSSGADRDKEAGFEVGPEGNPFLFQTHQSEHGSAEDTLNQPEIPSAALYFHTHPDNSAPWPSREDIAEAKRLKKPILVQSREGLFEVDALGNVTKVKKGADWMDKPQTPTHETIYPSGFEKGIIVPVASLGDPQHLRNLSRAIHA